MLLYITLAIFFKCQASFINVTDSLFGIHNQGLLGAFSDINSDKNVDFIILNSDGKSIGFYINHNKKIVFTSSDINTINETIINVIPNDFDGDSIQDILLITLNEKHQRALNIFWGNHSHYIGPSFIAHIKDSPLIFDFNGDMLPDIYAESLDDHLRYYWIKGHGRFFTRLLVTTEELSPFAIPNSNSFLDINSDLIPDLFVTSLSSKQNINQFEIWINLNGKYTRRDIYTSNVFWVSNSDIQKQFEITYTGHSLFTDINAAGEMTHLCLVCTSNYLPYCRDWAILAWLPPNHDINTYHWEALYMYDWERNSSHNNYMIDFNYEIPASPFPPATFPPRMNVGDFNFDGFPDVMLVLTAEIEVRGLDGRTTEKIIRTPIVLENIPCGGHEGSGNLLKDHLDLRLTFEGTSPKKLNSTFWGTSYSDNNNIYHLHAYNCNHIGRRFRIMHSAITADGKSAPYNNPYKPVLPINDYLIQDAVLCAFFDIYNDGLFDVIIVRNVYVPDPLNPSSLIWKKFKIEAFKNNLDLDASFVKILVLNGKCWMDCKFQFKPYGIIPPGAVIKYQTTYSKDAPTQAISCQMMQTSHFALNLPYVIFGLGMRPNFIDKLEVGFARPSGQPPRYHSWTAIIPNSQMIIIPYPNNDSSKWQHILLLVPSYFIIKIGATLIATCLFLGMIIAILQWKEKKEDYYEKLRNTNQYHFDAL